MAFDTFDFSRLAEGCQLVAQRLFNGIAGAIPALIAANQ